jgi:hypothetical protein
LIGLRKLKVESIEVWESRMTEQPQIPPPRRAGVAGMRWVLIGLCAALILFSHGMSARLGFAALLVLAVIIGHYAGRWYGRAPNAREHAEPGGRVDSPPGAAESPDRRREARR